MNLIEELRSLDPRDPGRWPLAVRAGAVGICFLVLSGVLAYVFVWDEQRPERGAIHGAGQERAGRDGIVEHGGEVKGRVRVKRVRVLSF